MSPLVICLPEQLPDTCHRLTARDVISTVARMTTPSDYAYATPNQKLAINNSTKLRYRAY